MIQHPQKTAQMHIVERLKLSLYFLQTEKEKFESFALCIKNTQLHQTMIFLIQENDHYSAEMGSLIQKITRKNELIELGDTRQSKHKIENDVQTACEQSEKILNKIYKEIFGEHRLYDRLKKIISYS